MKPEDCVRRLRELTDPNTYSGPQSIASTARLASTIIERLAGELAEALRARDIIDMGWQAAEKFHSDTLSQLAARDAELKMCREALERMVTVNRRMHEWSPEAVIAADALAKLTKKEAAGG